MLTTGQMIDQLKIFEVAENQDGDKVMYGGKADLYYLDKDLNYDGKFVVCASFVNKDIWSILPKFVSFEEAKEAYEEGKTIICDYLSAVDKTLKCVGTFTKSRMDLDGSLSWYMIINGKWSIKGE